MAVLNSSESPAAETVTWPEEPAVTGAAAPEAVSFRGAFRGTATAGDLKSRQCAAADLVLSVTLVLSPAVSVTAPACSPLKPATALGGSVTVILLPVGRIGLPTLAATGNVAVTCAVTGRDPAGNAHE